MDLLGSQLWAPKGKQPEEAPEAITAALAKHPQCVLLGNGGMGKSTTLLQIALDACEASLVDPLAPLPVYVPLNALTPTMPLPELIRAQLARHGLQILPATLEAALIEGQFLLLLDGVNEIPAVSREQQRDRDLATFLQAHPRARTVLTTRREGYDPLLYKLPAVELVPLDRDGVFAFLHLNLPPHDADALFRHLDGDRADEWNRCGSLANLARSPLYVWMLTETYVANEGGFPKNRGQLFKRFVTFILNQRETGKGSRIHAETRQALLGGLALGGLRQGAVVTIPRPLAEQVLFESIAMLDARHLGPVAGVLEILDEMRKRVFGFVRAGEYHLRWEHQIFQEYFAAIEILSNPDINLESLIRCEHDRTRRRWEGTMQIAAGLARSEIGAAMVRAVCHIDPLLAGHVVLALDVEGQRQVTQEILTALQAIALTEDDDIRKAEATGVIGEIGGESAAGVLLEIAYGRVVAGVKNVACSWLAQLDPDRASQYALDQLEKGIRSARIQSVILLALLTESGKIDCAWIQTALSDENHRVNCMALRMVSKHGLISAIPAVIELLETHRLPSVRQEAARALGVLLTPNGVTVLYKAAMGDQNLRVRQQCVNSLYRYDGHAEAALADLAQHASDSQTRERAARLANRLANQ